MEGDAVAKFSLSDIWNLFEVGFLPNNVSKFSRQMINCIRAWNCIHKTSISPLNIEIIKQTHKVMMKKERHWDGKNVLGEYRKSPAFAGHIFLLQLALLKDIWKEQFLGFMKLKSMIQLWPSQICLEALSMYIHLKMETKEFVA